MVEESPIVCREAPLSTVYILTFFFDWRVSFEEVRTFHVCVRSFDLVELLVQFPRGASCKLSSVLGSVYNQMLEVGRVRISFVPLALPYDISGGGRCLQTTDLDGLRFPVASRKKCSGFWHALVVPAESFLPLSFVERSQLGI